MLLVVAALGFEQAVQRQLNDIRELCRAASTVDAVRDGAAIDALWSALRDLPDPSANGVALLKLAVPPGPERLGARDGPRLPPATPASRRRRWRTPAAGSPT